MCQHVFICNCYVVLQLRRVCEDLLLESLLVNTNGDDRSTAHTQMGCVLSSTALLQCVGVHQNLLSLGSEK